jgi:hypothetical protein
MPAGTVEVPAGLIAPSRYRPGIPSLFNTLDLAKNSKKGDTEFCLCLDTPVDSLLFLICQKMAKTGNFDFFQFKFFFFFHRYNLLFIFVVMSQFLRQFPCQINIIRSVETGICRQ